MRLAPLLTTSLLLASLSISCGGGGKQAVAPPSTAEAGVIVLTPEQLKTAGLSTAVIGQRTASEDLRLPGTLEADPRRLWRVSPVVDGVVQEVGAISHDVVRQGQMLARLRSAALGESQVAWLEARAMSRLATADRDRNMSLRKDGIVSESQWLRVDAESQRATAALAQAERRLALAGMTPQQMEALESSQRDLGRMTLTSPANGVILASTVSSGQAMTAGEEAFVVADLSTLWVTVHMPVGSLTKVARGARAVVRVSGSPQQSWKGTVSSLGGKVSATDQTAEGRVVVTNANGFLRPGMYAEVEIVGVPVQSLMVPTRAHFTVGNQSYVFQKIGEGRFRPTPVTAAQPQGEWTPVSGPGIRAGVEVVVGGLAELKSHWLYQGGE